VIVNLNERRNPRRYLFEIWRVAARLNRHRFAPKDRRPRRTGPAKPKPARPRKTDSHFGAKPTWERVSVARCGGVLALRIGVPIRPPDTFASSALETGRSNVARGRADTESHVSHAAA
jgi:hypothetical protein